MDAPRGRTQNPWAVIGLAIVTLGIYVLFWMWRVTGEVDQRDPSAGSRPRYRRSLLALLVVVPAFILGAILSAAGAASESPALLLIGVLVYLAAAVVAVAAAVYNLIAYWRVWKAVEKDEKAAGVADPIRPALHLALILIPIVNYVGGMWVLHRTQRALNGMWARPLPGGAPIPPPPVPDWSPPAPPAPAEPAPAPVAPAKPTPALPPAAPPAAVPADPDARFRPPAASPPARRFKHTCKQCASVSIVTDTGARPMPVTCAQCGRTAKLAVS